MKTSGADPVVAPSYRTVMEAAAPLGRSGNVGACFGLKPRRYQMERGGPIRTHQQGGGGSISTWLGTNEPDSNATIRAMTWIDREQD